MILQVPEEFQRKLDDFNASQGGPSQVAVAWHPKKSRWQVFAIPVQDAAHPMARNDVTRSMLRPLPDDSGRRGILLFTWCARNAQGDDSGFQPLDDRLFETLHWADSFRDKRHFEQTMEEPELRRKVAEEKRIRDIAYGAKEYYFNWDKLMMNYNTAIQRKADWRTTTIR
jgi:hypothetical protein